MYQWLSTEVEPSVFEDLRLYLKVKHILYEPSDCYNLVHVEMYVNEIEESEVNAFLDGNIFFRYMESDIPHRSEMELSFHDMMEIYQNEIDKWEYEQFDDWMYDMLRSGVYREIIKRGKS